MARAAQQQSWDELLGRSGFAPDRLEHVRQSPAYGPLLAALRNAESHGLDVERTFPRLVATGLFDDAEDRAAVIRGRVDRWVPAAGSRRRAGTDFLAGLVSRAVGATDPDMARGLQERDRGDAAPRADTGRASHRAESGLGAAARYPTFRSAHERTVYRSRHDGCCLPGTLEHPRRSPTLGSKCAARTTIEAISQCNLAKAAVSKASRLIYALGAECPEPELVAVDISPLH